jgi:Protein of unknown function (DUF1573)
MMNKKYFFLLVISFFCLNIAFSQTKSKAKPRAKTTGTQKANTGGRALKFEAETFPIGNVKQGTVINHKFKFKNVGSRPVEIKNATATCGCTVPDYPFIPIMPGEDGEIGVTFNTTNKLGHQKPVITVTSNAGTYYLSLDGDVTD